MSSQVADAQARLNVALRDIITLFEESGVQEHSISLLNSFIDKHLTMDFLALAEGYSKCMAFIDHNELITRILKGYASLLDQYIVERRMILKKIKALKEDKKADPEDLIKRENLLLELDNKKALAVVAHARLRAMNLIPMEKFKDPSFNAFKYYKENVVYVTLPGKKKAS